MSKALLALCKAEEFERELDRELAFYYAKPTARNAEKAKLKLQALFVQYYKLTPCYNTQDRATLFMPKHKCVVEVHNERYAALAFLDEFRKTKSKAEQESQKTEEKTGVKAQRDPLDADAVNTIIGEEIDNDPQPNG
jgi:hypothetical protein